MFWNGAVSDPSCSETRESSGRSLTTSATEIIQRRFLRCVCIQGVVIATVISAAASRGIAQESFLDEFRSVNAYVPEHDETLRSPSLTSQQQGFESDSGRSTYTSETDSAGGFETPDWDSPIHHSSFAEFCTPENGPCESDAEVACDVKFDRMRSGCYQGSQASYGWLSDNPDSGLSIRTLDTSATFAVPLGSLEHLIMFTPFFRADIPEGAATLDLPDGLFETGVKTFWRRPINDRLTSSVLFTPSVRSDFETTENAFRLFGMGLLTWKCAPEKLTLSGGVIYTGREDFPILPAMGLLWTPSPRWRMDLQFPSPRLSYRILKDGANSETWVYLAGVFGGNTWAVTRASGLPDELTIRDLRLVTGVEHLLTRNRGVFAETGLVFDRSLEYATVAFERDLDAAYMLRAGISF